MADPKEQQDHDAGQQRDDTGRKEEKADTPREEKNPLAALDSSIIFHEYWEDDYDFRVPDDDDFDVD